MKNTFMEQIERKHAAHLEDVVHPIDRNVIQKSWLYLPRP